MGLMTNIQPELWLDRAGAAVAFYQRRLMQASCTAASELDEYGGRGVGSRSGMSVPPHPEIPGEGLSRETEFELEHSAERYSQLHGQDDETERSPGLVARILELLRRDRR